MCHSQPSASAINAPNQFQYYDPSASDSEGNKLKKIFPFSQFSHHCFVNITNSEIDKNRAVWLRWQAAESGPFE